MSESEVAIVPSTPAKLTESQSNKLTRLAAFTPTNLTEAVALAKLIASSELAPKDYRGKPGNVLIAMQLGAELGVAPMQAIQNVAVINGRPSVWGDLALALVQSHPDYESHKEFMEGAGDNRRAVFQIKRRGQEWHQQAFSVKDALTAGLWGKVGPWKTNPDRMLQMRARGFGLRDKFADALKGLRLAEEAMDLPPESKGRDTGTLDVNREITSMTASSEPNRGHGNEAMAQAPSLSQAPSIDQTQKKQDDVMCSDCRQINGHTADCVQNKNCPECHGPNGKHATKCSLKPNAEAPSAAVSSENASVGTKTMLVQVEDVKSFTKKGTQQVYLIISVLDGENLEWQFSSWDTKHHPHLARAVGKRCILEFTEKQKADRKYMNLEHILEIGGVKFVNDKPAESDDWDGAAS